jgi:hypothetical protein
MNDYVMFAVTALLTAASALLVALCRRLMGEKR